MATVDEVKQALSIEAVIAEYVPTLKRAGATYKACCPFHSEKSPSFVVSPDRQSFKCFGCGAGGDVISFVEKIENVDFREAVRKLAEKAGLSASFDPVPQEDPEVEGIYAVNLAAVLYYQSQLRSHSGSQALEYVRGRGLTDETIARFALGYAPLGWDNLISYLTGPQRGFSTDLLKAAGLVTVRDDGGVYDRFRQRLMFPIRDAKGRVAGFGARALDGAQPKYLNTAQTRVFDKGSMFYCQDVAGEHTRKSGRIVIVEGYMDALGAHQAGFGDVVASMGTSLTDKQMRTLYRAGRKIVLALDADAAGNRAVHRTIQLAYQVFERQLVPLHTTRAPTERATGRYARRVDMKLFVAALPEGQDPDELILKDPGMWKRLVDDALPIVEFYFHMVTSDLSQSLDFKQEAAERLIPVIAEITDPVERDHYINKFAQLTHSTERVVSSMVTQYQQRLDSERRAQPATSVRGVDEGERPAPAVPHRHAIQTQLDPVRTVQRYLLSLLVRYPHAIPWVTVQLQERDDQLAEPALAGLARALVSAAEPRTEDTPVILERLPPGVRMVATDVLLVTASDPPRDDPPLQKELDRLFVRWDQDVIRQQLGKYEHALREGVTDQESALRHEVDVLAREIRTVFEHERPA